MEEGEQVEWRARATERGVRPCTVGVVSSRLGRALDLHRPWFAALRAVCREVDPRREALVSVRGTAASRYVERCAALFQLPLLGVDGSSGEWSWFPAAGRFAAAGSSGGPPFSIFGGSRRRGAGLLEAAAAPARDQALVSISDRLIALLVRPGGWTARLIEARLADSRWAPASVWIAIGPGLTRPELAERFLDLGATAWRAPRPEERPRRAPDCEGEDRSAPISAVSVMAAIGSSVWPYLTHCTRRRAGRWPDQSEEDYLDDLILDRTGADHSPLAALTRIVLQQKLIASCEGVRGATPVVSFTEASLADLPRLRVFRPHRGRWDFEPYGICIRGEWLARRGARPAIYGDDRTWAALSAEERPFFQLRATRRSGGRAADWTVEREWRCVGDLDLRGLPRDAGFVFAPRRAEARRLAALGRWPAVVLDL